MKSPIPWCMPLQNLVYPLFIVWEPIQTYSCILIREITARMVAWSSKKWPKLTKKLIFLNFGMHFASSVCKNTNLNDFRKHLGHFTTVLLLFISILCSCYIPDMKNSHFEPVVTPILNSMVTRKAQYLGACPCKVSCTHYLRSTRILKPTRVFL